MTEFWIMNAVWIAFTLFVLFVLYRRIMQLLRQLEKSHKVIGLLLRSDVTKEELLREFPGLEQKMSDAAEEVADELRSKYPGPPPKPKTSDVRTVRHGL